MAQGVEGKVPDVGILQQAVVVILESFLLKVVSKLVGDDEAIKRLACRMTMLTVMTMFLIYPFTLSHEHRHQRHHRHAYSEMTLAVYYCLKQK